MKEEKEVMLEERAEIKVKARVKADTNEIDQKAAAIKNRYV